MSSKRKSGCQRSNSNPSSPKSEHHHKLSVYRRCSTNFQELARISSDFRDAWQRLKEKRRHREGKDPTRSFSFSTHVDFAFNLSLTRVLLARDFGLLLPSFPEGHLVPPVCNRLNYVCWIRELLNSFQDEKESCLYSGDVSCKGIDIGTGVSCIYPLLLSSAKTCDQTLLFNNKWKFYATDIDPIIIKSARINVESNHLQEKIKVFNVGSDKHTSKGPLYMAVDAFVSDLSSESKSSNACDPLLDFMMTNPPFYSSKDEAFSNRKGDNRCRTDMSEGEGIYELGGELGFVKEIFKDSQLLGNKILWYSSMLGKKTNALALEKFIRSTGLEWCNVKTTTFLQGKTTRWGVSWTFITISDRAKGKRKISGNTLCSIKTVSQENRTHCIY